ncbi:hypothetical protein FHR47_001532 [Xanthomonas arboricola]|uniref:DarT ssDNA thymidine ADP-ribosyltransferase family protein n=1 Tax=Xanthomonas cannabis TaxID=1885674 RepID=UPI0017BEDE08|nr:hypothetical protein [Xanthomonas cannabis]
MPIAQGRAEAHVAEWVKGLSSSRAPYRQLWPKFVFRHEEISNAVKIIELGSLLSRAQAVGYRDVAAVDIVTSTERAHAFSRLYFRPMSPTQYRIEGIRRPSEIWHGAHAPVLVMFAFDAVSVLSRAGTQFSNGNMQSVESNYDSTESFFSEIAFADVYHVGSFTQDQKDRIVRSRCAEVLATSPLPLAGNLRAIICRSPAERAFLLESVGSAAASQWGRFVVSHTEPGIFENKWAYVETVDVSGAGVRIKFHPRQDASPCQFAVKIYRNQTLIWNGKNEGADMSLVWNVKTQLNPGVYRCVIEVDGCLAYSASHLVDELPF